MGLGDLRVFNDDRLVPGAAWPMHPHRAIEGITYVAAGTFEDAAVYAALLDPRAKVRHEFRPGFGGYLFVVHGSLAKPELDEGGAAKIWSEPAIEIEAGDEGAEVLLVETKVDSKSP